LQAWLLYLKGIPTKLDDSLMIFICVASERDYARDGGEVYLECELFDLLYHGTLYR
jgi:hypothetical protein